MVLLLIVGGLSANAGCRANRIAGGSPSSGRPWSSQALTLADLRLGRLHQFPLSASRPGCALAHPRLWRSEGFLTPRAIRPGRVGAVERTFPYLLVRASRAMGTMLAVATLLEEEPSQVYRWIAGVELPPDQRMVELSERLRTVL